MYSQSTHYRVGLDDTQLLGQVPAIFATDAGPRTSAHYTFIPTHKVIQGLRDAGFVPVQARQSGTRKSSPGHARHIVRLRTPRFELTLEDAIPEVVLLNSHDGSSAYELRAGLFRPVCTNGLMVSLGDFVSVRIAHRGDVVERVVDGALEISERLSGLSEVVRRMADTELTEPVREAFAREALELRYGDAVESGYRWTRLLNARRAADIGADVWRTYNTVQENLLGGGLLRRSPSGRMTQSRRITAIREDVRLNTGLWDIATRYLAAA